MPGFSVEGTCEIDLDDVKEAIQQNYNPEEIFDKDELSSWAEGNGFVREES